MVQLHHLRFPATATTAAAAITATAAGPSLLPTCRRHGRLLPPPCRPCPLPQPRHHRQPPPPPPCPHLQACDVTLAAIRHKHLIRGAQALVEGVGHRLTQGALALLGAVAAGAGGGGASGRCMHETATLAVPERHDAPSSSGSSTPWCDGCGCQQRRAATRMATPAETGAAAAAAAAASQPPSLHDARS